MPKVSRVTPIELAGERIKRRAKSSATERSRPKANTPTSTVRGIVVRWTDEGLFVICEGDSQPPRLATSLIPWEPLHIEQAIASREPVFLIFEEGDLGRPVIVGRARSIPLPGQQPTSPVEATVDGVRVLISARDEVVLRCGEASITLRRNGRVLIKGAYVETRARGTNRIKGGHVSIN